MDALSLCTSFVVRRAPLLVVSLLLAIAGCAASSTPQDPAAALADPEASVSERVRAVRAQAAQLDDPAADHVKTREGLKGVAWRRSESPRVRLAAIEALVEADPEDTSNMLRLMLPTETQWTVIEDVCELAIDRGWTALTPALVRSWSRPVLEPPDEERPERAALIALHPDRAAEDIVFETFAAPVDGSSMFGERVRQDAWALLSRIDPDGARTTALLQGDVASDDPLIITLRRAARELRAVPRTSEQLRWLERLSAPDHERFWRESADAIARLTEAQRTNLALRHAAPLRWAAAAQPDLFTLSRERLLDSLERRLDGRPVRRRTANLPEGDFGPGERLKDWADELTWADLIVLLSADAALADESTQRALFEHADADQRDRSTEYGGVIDLAATEGSAESIVTVTLFPPRPAQRVADNRFIPSQDMIEAGDTAILHYHFHAQRHAHSQYAGPGPGDLTSATALGRSNIVLTFINRNELNVDYYQPNGARIDLGLIRRP